MGIGVLRGYLGISGAQDLKDIFEKMCTHRRTASIAEMRTTSTTSHVIAAMAIDQLLLP
jgi:hypothetical protein